MTFDRVSDTAGPASPAVSQAVSPSASAPDNSSSSADGRKLAGLASEFEAMLLGQMLREMRQAGNWKDESEGDSAGLGGQPLFDAIDTELALRLAKAQPLGLGNQLVREITRGQQGQTAAPGAFPLQPAPVALPLVAPSGAAAMSAAGVTPAQLPVQPSLPNLDGATVTSGFGWRRDPLTGVPAFHKGIDVRATYGDDVAAAGPGRVVVAQSQGAYGQTVVVDHGGGLRTRYAHLSSVGVQVGDTVAAGEPVGRAGRSGRATGTHVHFEATQGGQPVDPAEFPGRLKAATPVADVGTGSTDSWRRP